MPPAAELDEWYRGYGRCEGAMSEPVTKGALEAAQKFLDDWFGNDFWPPVYRFPDILVAFAAERVADARRAAIKECAKVLLSYDKEHLSDCIIALAGKPAEPIAGAEHWE